MQRFGQQAWQTPFKGIFSRLARRAYTYEFVRTIVRPVVRLREPAQWLFLVGCYNSGTTITQAMLAAHPEIRNLPREGVRFTSVLTRPEDLGWTRMWGQCTDYVQKAPEIEPYTAARLMKDWSPLWESGGRVFMDKSISNSARMEWLDLNFPTAHFIGIIRNGYCVAEGIRRRARPGKKVASKVGAYYPLRMAGEQWILTNEKILQDAKNVSRCKLIYYEDLTRDPIKVLQEIWTFLGLDTPPMHRLDDRVEINGQAFHIRNMNTESLARLTKKDFEELSIIAAMQKRLGYEVLE